MKMNLLKHTFFLIFFFNLTLGHSQSYWEDIINNNRADGLSKVEEAYSKSATIENLISREIILHEGGKSAGTPGFISKLMTQSDFPNYLFALWNEQYIFSEYISTGFSKKISDNVKAFSTQKYSDITLASSMSYMNAIVARNYKNFPMYKKYCAEVSIIRDWDFCGVFENLNNSGHEVEYDPETNPTNSKPFEANSNGKVQWYTPAKVDPTDAYTFFVGHSEYGRGVHYAQTFIANSSDKEAVLRLGGSGKLKVWLNDVVVFESDFKASTNTDAYLVSLNLPKGTNRLLVKVSGNSSAEYFSARFTDKQGQLFNDLSYSNKFSEYNKSTLEQLKPVNLTSSFEQFFEEKVKSDPTNFLYSYCLAKTYLRNENHEKAKSIINPLYEANPNSSILRRLMIEILNLEENYTLLEEIKENMMKDDENYHLSMSYKFQDTEELFRMAIGDMEAFLTKYVDLTEDELVTATVNLVVSLRKQDQQAVRRHLDKLVQISQASESVNLLKSFAPLYSSVFKDTKTHIKLLEGINKKFFDYNVRMQLANYYDDINKMPKALAMLQENAKFMDNDFYSTSDLVEYLQDHERYKESMPYIDRLLAIYPYSFFAMEFKGNAYLQTGDTENALKMYNQSLIYNSANASLRRNMEDISNKKDLLEEFVEKDIYDYIAKNKNKNLQNNYGFNVLKSDAIIQLYNEAGGRSRFTLVYEITSEKGIERFKEYDLDLYGNYNIIKSEIVKKNGSINPADASGSSFVFTGLSIGDVILIDYQKGFNSTGRFYKDYVDNFNFDGFHPIVNKRYILIAPKEKEFEHMLTKEGVSFTTNDKDENKIYTWELKNHPGCARSEDYMPELVDFSSVLHISTLKSWNEIANWYSDLVRSQMLLDDVVKREYKVIFPEENVKSLTEDERAKRIYYYMMNNFNYSSVNFRQSGFVPQKPGKTLLTKLGDCKDFSTVFVTFAKMAGLEANLVLTLTSDNGRKSLILPSTDFNHCIARVMINGKEQFLELTDKNLPYRALPNGVRNAAVLIIPEKTSEKEISSLRILTDPARIDNIRQNIVEMNVASDKQKFTVKTTLKGETRSYWADVFDTPTYENYKKEISDFFQKSINSSVMLDTVYTTETKREGDLLSYESKLTLNEKLNKIGDFKIIKIPYINFEYTGDIISETERKHEINYSEYEETDFYSTTYVITLDEAGEFVEIPKDKTYTYKGHSYTRTYKKTGPKQLKIEVTAKPSVANISTAEYAEFKAFVKNILEAKDEFVGYK